MHGADFFFVSLQVLSDSIPVECARENKKYIHYERKEKLLRFPLVPMPKLCDVGLISVDFQKFRYVHDVNW